MGQAVQAPAGSSQAVQTRCLAWRRHTGPASPGAPGQWYHPADRICERGSR
jgi:hypothetical protein